MSDAAADRNAEDAGPIGEEDDPAGGDRGADGDRGPSLILPLMIGAAFFMEGLDATIVATSLPQIASSLDMAATDAGVTMTAYLLSLSVFIPASGWLADRFDARRVFLSAIGLFVIGSLVCGVSNGLPMMIGGRILQGAGGAMMTPVGRLILARVFPRHELVRALSYMIVPGLMGPMLGPVIGGWITTEFHWRWIFFVNIPLGVAAILFGLRYIESLAPERATRFDFTGFALIGATLAALQVALEITAAERGVNALAGAAFACAAAAGLLFARHAGRAEAPIFDPGVFRTRTFAIAVLGGAFSRIALGATLFLFPLLFQLGFGATPFEAGLLLAILAIGQMAVRVVVHRIMRVLGVRVALMTNTVGLMAMLAGMVLFAPDTPRWLLGAYLFVFGLIHSVQLSTLAALHFSGLPSEVLGSVTSITAVAQRISMAMGITVSALLLGISTGDATPTAAAFDLPLLSIAVLTLGSLVGFSRLRRGDGGDLVAKA